MKKLFLFFTPMLLLALPTAPSHLSLQALSTTDVAVSWQDNSSEVSSRGITMEYHDRAGGLDGKVSFIKVSEKFTHFNESESSTLIYAIKYPS